MSVERRIARVTTNAPLAPGFIGAGHLATLVIPPGQFEFTDPFILMADDHLDLGQRSVGGAHPHASFETVTLLLEGSLLDRDEGGIIETGEMQWMTAGSGIIHGENVQARGTVRLLQLWLTLPRRDRWTTPAFQDLRAAAIPVRREPGVDVRLYSGSSGNLRSATRNHVPVTLAELVMQPNAVFDQDTPLSYNGFVFVVSGTARVGADLTWLEPNQAGWFDRHAGAGESIVRVTAGADGARLVFLAGQPQGGAIVSHGPFIGDTREDIARLYGEFREGRFERMSHLARARKVS